MKLSQIRLFRYQEDRLPFFIIVTLFCADLLVFSLVDNILVVSLWCVLGLFPKVCLCAWNHHHQHLPTFEQTALNRMLEVIYAFQTGVTTNAWVLHHVLGHHLNYLDQEKDEAGWKRKDGTMMGTFEFTAKVALAAYPRAFRVGKNYPRYQRGFLGAGVLTALLLAVFFYINWVNALILFALPMVFGFVATVWHTYYHHAGLDTDNHFEASYNITHRWYNILTGNLGYHAAHHIKPGLHWSKLPAYHESIAYQIPPELFRKPGAPFNWFPAK